MIQKGNATLLQRFPKDYFASDVDRSKCLHATSSNAFFCMYYICNMFYHKLSHNAISYRINGKNVNVMLEFKIITAVFSGIRIFRILKIHLILICVTICIKWLYCLHMSDRMTKPTKWPMCQTKTQISLGICPVWSESSLSAWRNIGPLTTYWAHSEDSDQTGRMPRLIWIFAGHTCHFVGFVVRQLML